MIDLLVRARYLRAPVIGPGTHGSTPELDTPLRLDSTGAHQGESVEAPVKRASSARRRASSEHAHSAPSETVTTGELSRMMGVTARTLQHYNDGIGILKPSGYSSAGRLLYTKDDLRRLHQIQMYKALGFTLKEIRDEISGFTTPKQFTSALASKKRVLTGLIEDLVRACSAIDAVASEIDGSEQLDLGRVAEVIAFRLAGRPSCPVMPRISDRVLERLDELDRADSTQLATVLRTQNWPALNDRAAVLVSAGSMPDWTEAQALARDYKNLVLYFCDGDDALLADLAELALPAAEGAEPASGDWIASETFLADAIEHYLSNDATLEPAAVVPGPLDDFPYPWLL